MRPGTLSAKQIDKRIEVSEWEQLYFHYREMSKAGGAKKPSESQKAYCTAGNSYTINCFQDTKVQV